MARVSGNNPFLPLCVLIMKAVFTNATLNETLTYYTDLITNKIAAAQSYYPPLDAQEFRPHNDSVKGLLVWDARIPNLQPPFSVRFRSFQFHRNRIRGGGGRDRYPTVRSRGFRHSAPGIRGRGGRFYWHTRNAPVLEHAALQLEF